MCPTLIRPAWSSSSSTQTTAATSARPAISASSGGLGLQKTVRGPGQFAACHWWIGPRRTVIGSCGTLRHLCAPGPHARPASASGPRACRNAIVVLGPLAQNSVRMVYVRRTPTRCVSRTCDEVSNSRALRDSGPQVRVNPRRQFLCQYRRRSSDIATEVEPRVPKRLWRLLGQTTTVWEHPSQGPADPILVGGRGRRQSMPANALPRWPMPWRYGQNVLHSEGP